MRHNARERIEMERAGRKVAAMVAGYSVVTVETLGPSYVQAPRAANEALGIA